MSEKINKNKKRRPYKYTSGYYRKLKAEFKETTRFVKKGSEKKPHNKNQIQSTEHLSLTTPLIPNTNPVSVEDDENTEIFRNNCFHSNSLQQNVDEGHSETDELSEDEKIDVKQEIKNWILRNNITRRAADELLYILNKNNIIDMKLPKDSRVLISTPKTIDIVKMGVGEFHYIGLEKCLKNIFKDLKTSMEILLIFNMDGLPLYKSSKSEFWPILCAIDSFPHIRPMVVGIYKGEAKPDIQKYLAPFIDEIKGLIKDGVHINGYKVTISINCFICDSPARCHMKGTTYYNSYHGCMRCTVIGEYDKEERHMSFPRVNMSLRTDENFRMKSDPFHHKKTTPLCELPIDLVKDFPIADSLHLLDLGVMKRCLLAWVKGKFKKEFKWSGSDIQKINLLLKSFNDSIPCEIHRAVRTLDCLSHWKALEFRTFLLYLGPIILKDFLPIHAYKHFLMLYCAVTICSSSAYLNYINIAENLFKDYIENFILLYGKDKISINIHNLCHIVEDVKRFGELPKISAYKFENMLYILKNLVRGGNKPLVQVAKRLCEISQLPVVDPSNNTFPYVKGEKKNIAHTLPTCNKVFSTLCLKDGLTLSDSKKNKWFMTTTNEIVSIINVTYSNNTLVIYGQTIQNKCNFFTEPFDSSFLNIYSSLNGKLSPAKLYHLHEIKFKLICLNYHQELVFIPLLHTV